VAIGCPGHPLFVSDSRDLQPWWEADSWCFRYSLPAFGAAGGLVIVLMGLEMLRGTPTRVQHDDQAEPDRDDPIIIPFAMPLVAGPGAITTVITLTAQHEGWPVK